MPRDEWEKLKSDTLALGITTNDYFKMVGNLMLEEMIKDAVPQTERRD